MIAKIRKRVALAGLVFAVLSFHFSYSESDTPKDGAELKQLIYDLFEAIDTHDYLALRQLCTEDFVLFEARKIMDMDAAVAFLRPFEGRGKMTRTFSEWRFHVDGSAAWMHLKHRASGMRDGKEREIEWFESAGFLKVQNIWKIALYHNSVVKSTGE